ncbi:MAG: HAD family hydrolase [Isosphaeraceae bacterium]
MSQSIWPTFDRPPAVAFVDVDGTLLAETTTFLFARILYSRGLIRRSFFLRALYHGLQHRLGRLDYGRLIETGLTYIARIPIVELERIAYENFVEHIRPRLYEGVVEHLYSLKRAGTGIVLISSSPGLVIAPLSIYLGCRDTITTPVVIERGRLVGVGSGPACYGDGKRHRAEEWARSNQILMEDAVAYADNWSDRSLLERVGRAVVVNPRGRLLRLARARGWCVVRPEQSRLANSISGRTLRQRIRRRLWRGSKSSRDA